jgi:two-component system chemotaxis sensor kinase CheA
MEHIRMRLAQVSEAGGEAIAIAVARRRPPPTRTQTGKTTRTTRTSASSPTARRRGEAEPQPAEPAPIVAEVHAPAPVADATSIRVSVAKVDSLVNLVGELVITEAMLAQSARAFDYEVESRFAEALAQLERNTRDLQEAILGIRMIPMSFVFSRLPRMARDIAARLGKDIELEIHGEETELDKRLIEQVTDPLLHLVRNAIDHGIEAPAIARRTASPRAATFASAPATRAAWS